MTWMRLDASAREHRKIGRLADDLGIPHPHALGLCACLWTWALTNAPDGDLGDMTAAELARAAQWTGDPRALLAALLAHGLVDEHDHGLAIHDWMNYAEGLKVAKRKAIERERRRATGERPRQSRDSHATVTPDGRTDETRRDGRDETIVDQCLDAGAANAASSADAAPTPSDTISPQDAPQAREEPTPPPEGRVVPESTPEPTPGPAVAIVAPEPLALIAEVVVPPVAVLPVRGGKRYDVTRADLARWTAAYPAVEVEDELARMVAWLDANPERQPASRASAFVVRWLSRAQDQAAMRGSHGARAGPSRPTTAVDRVAERAREALAREARERGGL